MPIEKHNVTSTQHHNVTLTSRAFRSARRCLVPRFPHFQTRFTPTFPLHHTVERSRRPVATASCAYSTHTRFSAHLNRAFVRYDTLQCLIPHPDNTATGHLTHTHTTPHRAHCVEYCTNIFLKLNDFQCNTFTTPQTRSHYPLLSQTV